MHPITVEANPVAVAAELDTRLGQFNEEQVGLRNTLNFVLSVRDRKGELGLVSLARLSGMPSWSACSGSMRSIAGAVTVRL